MMDQKALRLLPRGEADWTEEDLDQLYRRHAPWLNARLRHRFGAALDADADDLVHDAYARLGPSTGDIQEPRALLLRIASNLAKDLLRRREVRRRHVAEAVTNAALAPHPLNALDALTAKELILSLPEAQRDVFVMSRFHGLTYQEIADRCGISVKTVEWRLQKATAHCAKRLRD